MAKRLLCLGLLVSVFGAPAYAASPSLGGISPRQHDAIVEGGKETIIPDYAKLIDEYYKTLGKKGSER